MHKDNIIVGIDIGSSAIKAVVAEQIRGEENLRIIGVGVGLAAGIRRGVVIDSEEVSKIISQTLQYAQRMAGVELAHAIVNIGGSDIAFQSSKGVVAVGRADGEVVEDDINRVINEAQSVPMPMNKEIVHVIPKKYRLDDQDNIKDPLGMKGVRLEVEALIIESSSTQVKNINKAAYQAGLEIDDIVLEPLAASKAILNRKQKELGVVLINIGGGTTSLAVYEEDELVHVAIIPIGAGHITNDIAIGLRTSVDVAEKIKLEYGCAFSRDVSKKEGIDLAQIDSQEDGVVSRHHVAEIIEARLEEIFELVLKELKIIGKAGLLPAGAILVGGGAKMPQIVELAKEKLRLPIQIGFPAGFGGILDKIDDPSFATVAGLVLWAREHGGYDQKSHATGNNALGMLTRNANETSDKVRGWIRKFLP